MDNASDGQTLATVLHVAYFWLLIPFITAWIVDELIGNGQFRRIVRRKKRMLLVCSFLNLLYSAYLCVLCGMNATFEGRGLIVACMFIVLFILMVADDFREDFDAQSGVFLMYFGASLSCFMVVAEQISGRADVTLLWFNAGAACYAIGLLLVASVHPVMLQD